MKNYGYSIDLKQQNEETNPVSPIVCEPEKSYK
jgi:hypothetical protein